jgi:hypothetical protein
VFGPTTDLTLAATAALPPLLLIDEQRRPAIAEALGTIKRSGGDPDLGAAVSRIAHGRSALPLRSERRMRIADRLIVVVDVGDAMGPLRVDTHALLIDLQDAVSRDRMTVLRFADRPGDGMGTGPHHTWTDFDHRLAAPGTRVIVVSHAGAACHLVGARRRTFEQWSSLGREWSDAGVIPVLLTPYPLDRYPPVIDRLYTVVHWTEQLTQREIFSVAASVS